MRKFFNHYRDIVLVVVGVLLLCVLWGGCYWMLRRNLAVLERQIAGVEQRIILAQAQIDRKDEIEQAELMIGAFRDEREKPNPISLMSMIDRVAKSSGVEVAGLRPVGPAEPGAVALTCQGEWNEIVPFFIELQEKPHYLDVQHLRLTRKASFSNTLLVDAIIF